jgi:hypothetical protein
MATKAEKIYNNTMIEIRHTIKVWGIGKIDACPMVTEGTNGLICQRTINAMGKLLANEENTVNHYIKYLGMDESLEKRIEAIRVMRNSLENAQHDYVDWFKAI